MSFIGRLLGKHPPRVPAGGRSFVSQDNYEGSAWSVRVMMPGQDPTTDCKRLGPSFALQTTASAYLDWIEGRASSFSYPAGSA